MRVPGTPVQIRGGRTRLLHIVLGFLVFEPTLFPGGDNAHYLILGEALRTGEGYRDLYLPGTPLHTQYPPLLPLILSVLGWIGGVLLAKGTMLLFTATAVWMLAQVGRQYLGTGPALAAAAMLAANPTLLEYGHYVLSEAPFVLLVLTTLWLAGRPGRRNTAMAVLTASAAFATRTAGMALLVTLPLAWLFEGRRRAALWGTAGAIASLAGWAVYQRFAGAAGPSYVASLLLRDPYEPAAGAWGRRN